MKIQLISADGLKGEVFEHPGCRYFLRAIMQPVDMFASEPGPFQAIRERKYEIAERLDADTYAFREVLETTAFERVRKQEIDALNKQADEAWERSLSATYASYLPTEPAHVGTVPLDEDGPESYDDLLAWLDDVGEPDDYDRACVATAREAGDMMLASLLQEQNNLDTRIAAHARAMQAARKQTAGLADAIERGQQSRMIDLGAYIYQVKYVEREALKAAYERPGVMIQADAETDEWWAPLKNESLAGVGQAIANLKRKLGPDYGKSTTAPTTERTCTTCSKTCDVGVPCWWCGNA